MIKRFIDNIEKLNKIMEKSRIAELTELLQSKRKIFVRNLIAGISKGLGFSIGFYVISDIVDIVELNKK